MKFIEDGEVDDKVLIYFCVIAFFIGAAIFIFVGVRYNIKSKYYKETSAKLIKFEYIGEVSTYGDSDKQGLRSKSYKYKEIYAYIVNNIEYEASCTNIYDSRILHTPRNVYKIILYNPNNPKEVTFKRSSNNIYLICGGIFIVLGLGIGLAVYPRHKKEL